MSAARIVSGVILAVTAVATACSDGGPPGASDHTGSHHAPETAADGGSTAQSQPDAADSSEATDASVEDDAGDEPDDPKFQPSTPSAPIKSAGLAALCDGSPGITFSAFAIPGGQEGPASKVMT